MISRADTNFIDENGLRQGYWRITAAMKNDARYAPESVLEEGNYLDDKRTGVWHAYFPSGKIKSTNGRAPMRGIMKAERSSRTSRIQIQGNERDNNSTISKAVF